MSIAYSCLLIAVLLPFIWIACARFGKPDDDIAKRYNNYAPRLQQAKLEGYRARAVWAHSNAFEALPGFAAAILVAVQTGVPAATVNTAAVVFIIARLLHGAAYLANLAWQRSFAWAIGLLTVIYLFVAAILRVA